MKDLDSLVLLSNYFYWENRNSYLELIERFIHGKMDGKQFDSEFLEMWRVDRDKTWKWRKAPDDIWKKEFPEFPHKIHDVQLIEIEGFSRIIGELFSDCEVFQPDPALRDYFSISEDELKNFVEKALLKMQKYL